LLFSRSLATSDMANMEYYRHDGVRITHDPYAPGMSEKYGRPGKTDREGFDPYADSVGAGIYGGIVKRNEMGEVIIGQQYQNHNPRPGPVYAGGGYTPMSKALGDNAAVGALLDKYPDLVNDISTGGAQPLHNCGMSQTNQLSTAFVISRGGDIEAVDTYGYTPLIRMASNNLAIGAKALLDAGADPKFTGGADHTAMDVARSSRAADVLQVLQEHGSKAKEVLINKIVIAGSGANEVNTEYVATDAAEIPNGFDLVCKQQGWDTSAMWKKLGGGKTWYKAQNEAYIYWNLMDGCWWIDAPNGNGIYKAVAPAYAPPQVGWELLGAHGPPPALVATFRQFGNDTRGEL
jgi:hypothetical protein